MRETKFKAWDKSKRRFLSDRGPYWCISPNGKFCWGDDSGGFYESDDCILILSTGRTDRNGTEIYEGSVLRNAEGSRSSGDVGVVEYVTNNQNGFPVTGYWIRVSDDEAISISPENTEVIGNIYENPDLLQ